MRRIQALAMAAAMTALIAFAAFPASAAVFGDLDDDGIFVIRDRGFDDGVRFVDGIDGAAPASQEFSERRITSGAANPTTRISNTGDNVNLCAPVQQIVNTGNVANEQGVVEDSSGFANDGFTSVDRFGFLEFGSDDLDFEGSNITIEPSATAECTQTIDQAAAV
jgi:hypothetical protein